jgi:two-component system secretion response regulator SsrB
VARFVAAHLELSVKTVESHRINLMRKLDMHETASLVRYAIRQEPEHSLKAIR